MWWPVLTRNKASKCSILWILERERVSPLKLISVTLGYKAPISKIYQLNFIDTPGGVDFSYEFSRSLAACEGAIFVVDAAQGVEAQTLAVCSPLNQGLDVVPSPQ